MNRAFKWILLIGGLLAAMVVIVILLVPLLVNLEHYKPQIEKQVSEATGRSFMLGGDLDLSLFPWAGLALTDLHLGNPPGFSEKDFISVKAFEVRVKLLPLLFKEIQVKRFVVRNPEIILEKRRDGTGNWQGLAKASDSKEKQVPKERSEGLPIKSLEVGEFTISGGTVVWIDQASKERRKLSDVSLQLQDLSLDRPIRLDLGARLDGKPLSVKGLVGPVGREIGKGAVALDIVVKALQTAEISLKGRLLNPAVHPQFDLNVALAPFSPRKLAAALDHKFPVNTADPGVLDRVSLKVKVDGDPTALSLTGGVLELDQSTINFTLKAKSFSKPDIAFKLNLDDLDVDRYLPPPAPKESAAAKGDTSAPQAAAKKTDYGLLRRLVLDGTIEIDRLKVSGARLQNLKLKLAGKNGQFNLDPVAVNLYGGGISATAALDVRQDIPKSSANAAVNDIQAGPLLQDVLKKDILEGKLTARLGLNMSGDDALTIKKTLDGKGRLEFRDGAIKGFDLAEMVRNVQSAFGLAEKAAEKPKTDFAELFVPFTLTKGLVETTETSLVSPLLRILAAGKADLVTETLDFRIEPKVVGTLVGQGDTQQRSGLLVPVLVGGNFSKPTFRPDLKSIVQQTLKDGIPDTKQLQEKARELGKQPKEALKPLEEKAKDFLKNLPFKK